MSQVSNTNILNALRN